jgi:beta-phosphoglucomutase
VPVRALLLDFNGTLSDDEPLLCELFGDLFAEQGKPMTPKEYYDRLSGLADHDIVRTWLDRDDPAIVIEYVRRYIARAGDGSTIPADARAAVRAARSAGVRLAVVSGAPHAAIDAALRGAGLKDFFSAIVAAEDVDRGKPDPAGYLQALDLLDIAPRESVAIEDSEAGVAAARAAGVHTVGVTGTVGPARLDGADELVQRLDIALVDRLLVRD